MYRAQLSDGEQIDCTEYDLDDRGVTLYGDGEEFLAFVPFTNLLWVGELSDGGQTKW